MKKKIVITSGGTSEAIDSVRKITNSATGKLGLKICNNMLETQNEKIEKIYYICSRDSLKPEESDKVEVIIINGAVNLRDTVEELLKREKIDIFIQSMAVSDYTTDYVTTASRLAEEINKNTNLGIEEAIRNNKNVIDNNSKISSYEDNLIIKLKPTPKTISIIKDISKNTYLVGFKLLNNVSDKELYDVSYNLLKKNKCDLVIGNDLSKIRQGNHEAFFIDTKGNKTVVSGKDSIAEELTNILFK